MQAAYYGDMELVKTLVVRGARINRQDRGGMSALTNAVWSDRVGVVRFLLAHGANPRLRNGRGETILQIAQARANGSPDNTKVLALLRAKASRASPPVRSQRPGQAAAGL